MKEGNCMEKAKKEINVILGERLFRQRRNCGYTREAFSEKICVSPRFLADIEAGKVGVSLTTLTAVCKALCISSDYLLGLEQQGEADEDMAALRSCINELDPTSVKYAPKLLKDLNEAVKKAKNV